MPTNATSAGPTASFVATLKSDGSLSATVVRAPVAGSIFEIRPLVPTRCSAPSTVMVVSPPVPASAT
jgi:hypothetical protein